MTITTEMKILQKRFKATYEGHFKLPRYNIAPGQNILALLNTNPQTIQEIKWGLSPSWAKTPLINIRIENLEEKPTFHQLLQKNRCLILADGFYEWKREEQEKTPYYISLKNNESFAFAGLWREKNDTTLECAIITVPPNDLMAPIHHRMPAIVQPSWEETWLDSSLSYTYVLEYLKPYTSEEMCAQKVSTKVNSALLDSPDLISAI